MSMAMFRFLNCYGLSHNVVVNGSKNMQRICRWVFISSLFLRDVGRYSTRRGISDKYVKGSLGLSEDVGHAV